MKSASKATEDNPPVLDACAQGLLQPDAARGSFGTVCSRAQDARTARTSARPVFPVKATTDSKILLLSLDPCAFWLVGDRAQSCFERPLRQGRDASLGLRSMAHVTR